MVDLPLPDSPPAGDSGDAERRLVARVRAWQHRHPLARRVAPAQVAGLGVIALPWGPPAEGGDAGPLFHQPRLLPGLSHRTLVQFARAHGVTWRPGAPAWPQRDIERSDASPEPAPGQRYLLTAALAPGRAGVPNRLLIAPEGSAIWGRRELSPARLALAAAAAVLLLAATAVPWLRGEPSRPPLEAAPGASSSPASAPGLAMVPASVPALASSPASASASVPPVAVAPTASAPGTAASGTAPVMARTADVPSAPASSSRSAPTPSAALAAVPSPASAPGPRAAASAAGLLPAAPASMAPSPTALPMPQARASAAAASAVLPTLPDMAPLAPGPHYALVSAPVRKREDAELTLAQVHKVLGPAMSHLRAQIMPSPQGYVVTLWPLPTQPDAERLADVLSRRGVPMKWLEF